MLDLTPILEAIISLIAVIITYLVIPYIRSKVNDQKLCELSQWVMIAVEAAEQIYAGPGRGEEKKAYVVAFLNSKGLTYDPESVNALIESYVHALKGE